MNELTMTELQAVNGGFNLTGALLAIYLASLLMIP